MPTQDKIHELMFVDRHKVHVHVFTKGFNICILIHVPVP